MFLSRKWTALLAIFAVAVLTPPAQAHQQSPQMQKVIEAEQLVNQGNPDGALAIVQALIAENPEFAPAYFIAGIAYEAKEKGGATGDAKTELCQNAYDSFMKAAEYQPGWGIAHRMASMHAADRGDLGESWQQAIKAHQSGTDMSDAFAGLGSMSEKPADLEQQLAVKRVFVGPVDTETFENQADSALSGGSGGAASARTDVGRRVVNETRADLLQMQQEAQRQLADSRSFGVVQRQEMANYIMVFEVDYISDTQRAGDRDRASQNRRRELRGVVKLVDVQSGEEAYRRRIEFRDISSRSDLNRDFSQLMSIMEEWAAETLR